jgi:hypothetical protein
MGSNISVSVSAPERPPTSLGHSRPIGSNTTPGFFFLSPRRSIHHPAHRYGAAGRAALIAPVQTTRVATTSTAQHRRTTTCALLAHGLDRNQHRDGTATAPLPAPQTADHSGSQKQGVFQYCLRKFGSQHNETRDPQLLLSYSVRTMFRQLLPTRCLLAKHTTARSLIQITSGCQPNFDGPNETETEYRRVSLYGQTVGVGGSSTLFSEYMTTVDANPTTSPAATAGTSPARPHLGRSKRSSPHSKTNTPSCRLPIPAQKISSTNRRRVGQHPDPLHSDRTPVYTTAIGSGVFTNVHQPERS